MYTTPLPTNAAQAMLEHLSSVYPIEKDTLEKLQPMLKYEKIKRKAFLLEPGKVNDRMYYIHKGLLWCFYLITDDEEDKADIEVSTQFMRERDLCVSVESYYTGDPSFEYLQALEPCELFSVSKADLDGIYEYSFAFNYIGRELEAKYLKDWARQLRFIRGLRAEKRYAALCKADPECKSPQKSAIVLAVKASGT